MSVDCSGETDAGQASPTHLLPTQRLNQIELASRWNISPRTLERWRWLKLGPPYLKLGGRVAYRLEDIEAYEVERLRGMPR
jgi:hypothetical protein